MMGLGEGLELLKSELGSRLGGRKSADKLQTDLQIQPREHNGCIGMVAPQDVAQAVVGLDNGASQEVFQAGQGCDLCAACLRSSGHPSDPCWLG